MSPARRGAIIARDLRLLGITGLCLLGIGAWGAYAVGRMKAWRRWLSAGTAAAAVVALGLIWGRVVENISGTVENALLLVVVPAAGLFGIAVVVLASRDQPDRWLRRVAWLGTMGCFYAGYGIGWLVLWGYLGA